MNELVVADKAADWHRLKSLVLDSVSSPITKRFPVASNYNRPSLLRTSRTTNCLSPRCAIPKHLLMRNRITQS